MLKRPKPDESEEDILKLQEEFVQQKNTNELKPAAKVFKPGNDEDLKPDSEIQEENFEMQVADTFEAIPTDKTLRVIEKTPSNYVKQISNKSQVKCSIFAQKRLKQNQAGHSSNSDGVNIGKLKIIENRPRDEQMDTSEATTSNIVTSNEKDEIHKENVKVLQTMTEEEILEERQKLLSTMDPAIVAFLKSKQNIGNESRTVSIAEQNKVIDNIKFDNIDASREILEHPNSEKWLNFENVEMGKLAWMTNVDVPKYKKGELYEGRFDFNGWLLPFTSEINEKNRALFHHGDEPGRPGYTLQELFQLCRSNVLQQKIVALNTVANLLSLMQSGVYDEIIDIPLEQIFFMLRISLDDNTPGVLNASIKAIRNLFCYVIDETCLDNLLGFDTKIQPILAVDINEKDDDNTINDQQLSETNLIKCLIRTNIFSRIRYIINTIKPSTETIIYCIEILIRLARDSSFVVKQMLQCENLLESIITYFVPVGLQTGNLNSSYGCPLLQAVKLLRVLACRSEKIALSLINRYKVMDSIASYVCNEQFHHNASGLKLQIEAFNLWNIFIHYGFTFDHFKNIQGVLWQTFHYHVNNTDLMTSYVKQAHVAALLNLITSALRRNLIDDDMYQNLVTDYAIQKWTTQFENIKELSCGKLQISSAVLRCLTKREDLILALLNSSSFAKLTSNIRKGSNLLCPFKAHKSSPNLLSVEAAVWDTVDHVVPVLNTSSCMPFLVILSHVIVNSPSNKVKIQFLTNKNINTYLKDLNKTSNFNLVSNWFTRLESELIANILKIAVAIQDDIDTSVFYEIAVKCLSIFNSEQKHDVEFILHKIILNPRFYPCEALIKNLVVEEQNDLLKHALSNIDNIFTVYIQVLNIREVKMTTLSVDATKGNIIPIDWIYSPLVLLYSNQQQNNQKMNEEQQIYITKNCLYWIYIYETYFPTLANCINSTDRFCRIACTYLGSDNLFLDSEIHNLLEACLKNLLINVQDINFNRTIEGLSNFQDFYTQLLEQYQGVSYGDILFGNFILLPLMQHHNMKYRKTLWSEYAGAVQIFNVSPEQVMCPQEMFLHPLETDISLLKCYRQTLMMGSIRPHSFLYKIAKHHVEAYASQRNAKLHQET